MTLLWDSHRSSCVNMLVIITVVLQWRSQHSSDARMVACGVGMRVTVAMISILFKQCVGTTHAPSLVGLGSISHTWIRSILLSSLYKYEIHRK